MLPKFKPPQVLKRATSRKWKRRLLIWGLPVTASILFLVLGIAIAGPAPPKRIVLATGSPSGAYYRFGKAYAEALEKGGLEVDVRQTAGSVENLKLLLSGEADVAFVQGGVMQSVQPELQAQLRERDGDRKLEDVLAAIAAVYYEPLWVFHRKEQPILLLSDLRGRRVAVGAQGSGTLALARELLGRNDVTAENTTFLFTNASASAEILTKGEADAAMMVTGHESADVQRLIRAEGVKLMSFRRHVAYVRSLPYLGRIDLAWGALDLSANTPPQDVVLLSPAATLVCRRDLHPSIVHQFLRRAVRLHSGGDLMSPAGQFPNGELVDVPLHGASETYFQSGLPGFANKLPFWAVRAAFKMKILALPLITLLLPFFKLGGGLWRFRIIYLIRRHYDALRRIETQYGDVEDPEQLRVAISELESLRDAMSDKSRAVPASYQNQIYSWRLHIAMVLEEFEARAARADGPSVGGDQQ